MAKRSGKKRYKKRTQREIDQMIVNLPYEQGMERANVSDSIAASLRHKPNNYTRVV